MRTVEEINKEIKELKKELENAEGTETEVYSRITGYYTNMAKKANIGKQQEFKERKIFNINKSMSDFKEKK